MRSTLLDFIVCPQCLPAERPLILDDGQAENGDLAFGTLACPHCAARFAVSDGIADLRPFRSQPETPDRTAQDGIGYESQTQLAAYLWSHYADLWGDPEAGAAYAAWTKRLRPAAGDMILDAGCAVGRLTLEAAASCGLAVGVDLSFSFIRTARTIARSGALRFTLPLEGRLGQDIALRLPERLRNVPAEFILADVQALPFRRETFQAAASCNIVDKVPNPLAHLRECQRVVASPGGFLLCDPFSWSEETTPAENWLGGTEETGRALARIPRLLDEIPGWSATAGEPVPWTIRHHANRFERIFSQTIQAQKT